MDESQQGDTTSESSELSDSWMVVNETPADQSKDNGVPSDGSDGESVEVIDQEEYDEVLTGETDFDAAQTDEEVNGPKRKKYVHHPNEDVNAALNRLMVIAASIVVGLAVGHYLGYSEEVNDMVTTVKKLQADNLKLKNHICMTLENYDNHIMRITGNDYPELKRINEKYAASLTILLNITCPHIEAKSLGTETVLDELRKALLSGHMSDDELHGRIGKILKNHSNAHRVIDYMNFSDETLRSEKEIVTAQDKRQSATISQMKETDTFREHSSDIHAHAESLTVKTYEEHTSKKEIPEDLTWTSTLESPPVRVRVQPEATESALSHGLINSLTKPPSEVSEGCQAASNSKDSLVNAEVPNKSVLKHIVKDVVQEITQSLFQLHHDDIIRDIRNEAKKLIQSVSVFKSSLLLNMEVASKLELHLKHIKDMLYKVINSPDMNDKGKISEIFSSMNPLALHLEKAMDSLQLIKLTLNPKRRDTLNVERSNVCTISDFFKGLYRDNPHNTQNMEYSRKHFNEEYHMYTANHSPSAKNDIDVVTVEHLLHKSTMESDGRIYNLENLQKKQDDTKLITKQPLHGRPSKHKKRQPREIKEKKKKKQDQDSKKYKKSKQHSVESERYNKKDEGKHKNVKTKKEKHYDQGKDLRKQHHYKEEKHFKRELCDTRKKKSHSTYKWDQDSDYRRSNMSGDWVIDMNRARAESRENEHKSDWLFERANARKAKRNGKWSLDNWYFQRAEGRNSCRQKSSNEKNKIPDPPPNDAEKEYHDDKKPHQKQSRYFKPKSWISKAYMTVSKFRF